MKKHITSHELLNLAHHYAEIMSGCRKVHVGSVILDKDGDIVSFGANRAVPDLCRTRGCLREELYGDNNKTHRNPGDCRAIHSEIDAICSAKRDLSGATIYVTRYPCEACARAIAATGISRVVYGRKQEISEETRLIFESSKIEYSWISDWIEEDAVN